MTMTVCPHCKQRYDTEGETYCIDCDALLEPWSEGFDSKAMIRRATLGGDLRDKLEFLVPSKSGDTELPIVIDTRLHLWDDGDLFEITPRLSKVVTRPRKIRDRLPSRIDLEPVLPQVVKPVTPRVLVDEVERCLTSLDVYSSNQTAAQMQERVKTILGRHWLELYVGGRTPTAQVITKDRRTFLSAFASHLTGARLKSGAECNNLTITMATLVGEANVDLFKAAIKEECASAQFRDAVLLHGVDTYADAAAQLDWGKTKHFVVGGSSGAGKTFGTKLILRALHECALVEKNTKRSQLRPALFVPHTGQGTVKSVGNIVSVDGGDSRAVSQIRGIVLQCAVALGYKGIKDLPKKTGKMDFKEHIKNAARLAKVHVVEPRTFASSDEDYETVVTDPDRTVFCLVHTQPAVIAHQGDSRAWYNFVKHKDKALLPINPNNREIGCESKAYGSMGRIPGKVFSQKTLKHFIAQSVSRNKRPLTVEMIGAGRVNGPGISYKHPTVIWVYFNQPPTSSLFGGFEIVNPLKFEKPAEVFKRASSLQILKDRTEIAIFPDRYCVVFHP